MPTGTKLENDLASAKGLAEDLKTFALDTDNQEAKQMFNQLSSSIYEKYFPINSNKIRFC